MNAAEFETKVKNLIASANKNQQLENAAPLLSKPASGLVELFGPMTSRIMKDRAVDKANDLYARYYAPQAQGGREFQDAVHRIASVVRLLPIEASDGAARSLVSVTHLSTNFAANMNKAIASIEAPKAGLAPVLLQFVDSAITTALVFVPVAGPFLAPLSMGIGNAIGYGLNAGITAGVGKIPGMSDIPTFDLNPITNQRKADNKDFKASPSQQNILDGGTSMGKAVVSGVSGGLTATTDPKGLIGKAVAAKGFASLAAVFIGAAIDKHYDSVLKKLGDPKASVFMANVSLTQNQAVAQGINNTLSRLNLTLPESLSATQARIDKYSSSAQKDTIKVFGSYSQSMFKDFLKLIEKVIKSGVTQSFNDSTSKIDAGTLDDDHKIALLILGYFYTKDWSGAQGRSVRDARQENPGHEMEQTARQDRLDKYTSRYSDLETKGAKARSLQQLQSGIDKIRQDMSTTAGIIQRNQQLIQQYDSMKSGFGGLGLQMTTQGNYGEYQAAKSIFSKKTLTNNITYDFNSVGDLEKLKLLEPRCTDYFKTLKKAITSDIASTMCDADKGYMSDEEMQEMLKLYVGSLLIVNTAINDLELQKNSSMRSAGQKLSKGALSIEDGYVKLIDEAGFINRYSGNIFGQVSKALKAKNSGNGRLRWSKNASDTERAMLLSFCTVVAFNLDIGKISIGFLSWSEAKLTLHKICDMISAETIT